MKFECHPVSRRAISGTGREVCESSSELIVLTWFEALLVKLHLVPGREVKDINVRGHRIIREKRPVILQGDDDKAECPLRTGEYCGNSAWPCIPENFMGQVTGPGGK